MDIYELAEQNRNGADELHDQLIQAESEIESYQKITSNLMNLIETEAPELWNQAQDIEDEKHTELPILTELEELYMLIDKHEPLKAMLMIEKMIRRFKP